MHGMGRFSLKASLGARPSRTRFNYEYLSELLFRLFGFLPSESCSSYYR